MLGPVDIDPQYVAEPRVRFRVQGLPQWSLRVSGSDVTAAFIVESVINGETIT